MAFAIGMVRNIKDISLQVPILIIVILSRETDRWKQIIVITGGFRDIVMSVVTWKLSAIYLSNNLIKSIAA